MFFCEKQKKTETSCFPRPSIIQIQTVIERERKNSSLVDMKKKFYLTYLCRLVSSTDLLQLCLKVLSLFLLHRILGLTAIRLNGQVAFHLHGRGWRLRCRDLHLLLLFFLFLLLLPRKHLFGREPR